jgi:hypothetical protein
MHLLPGTSYRRHRREPPKALRRISQLVWFCLALHFCASVQNEGVASARIEAQKAVDARLDTYEHPETGLKSVFQQVKAAVGSQFGKRSSEYGKVSGIKY